MNKFFATLVAVSAALAAVDAVCPSIISRKTWGAHPGFTTVLPQRPVPFVLMHHTAGAPCATESTCTTEMRIIQLFHMKVRKFLDIGYNFLVGGDGNVYEGCGWGRKGAHEPSYNSKSISISMIGTFTDVLPTLAARNAAQALIQCGVELGHISKSYWLIGHRQAGHTTCPGTVFYDEIKNWPRYNPNIKRSEG